MKSLNQWLRKIHRWLVIPFVLIVIAMLFTRETPIGDMVQRVQQILMFAMIFTGGYLYLLPYLTKRQRARRRAAAVE